MPVLGGKRGDESPFRLPGSSSSSVHLCPPLPASAQEQPGTGPCAAAARRHLSQTTGAQSNHAAPFQIALLAHSRLVRKIKNAN